MRLKFLACTSLLVLSACGGSKPSGEAVDAVATEVASENADVPEVVSPLPEPSEAAPSASPTQEETPAPVVSAPVADKEPAAATKVEVAAAAAAPKDPPAAFARCAACHSTEPGKNKIGPSLAGVVGRKAGTLSGYAYSPALKVSGLTWSVSALDDYIAAPQKSVPGTKMPLGLAEAGARKAVIEYLQTLK